MSAPLRDFIINNDTPPEPLPDIAKCSQCGWKGPVSDCEQDQEGDWESGFYNIDLCPKCDDGGCIDDYDYSDEQIKLYNDFHEQKSNQS
jgi:hypothetical protein